MKTPFLILILSVAFSYGQSDCETSIDYGNNATAGKYANINGIKMYYETYGDATKQPLLLIHGNGGSIKDERCQIEYFKNNFYVIIGDNRFQGKSENGKEELTYNLMAKDYNSLLNQMKIDSTYIIGQSDGGIIGLIMAMDYPKKVKKLVSSSPNIRPDSTAVYQWDIDNIARDLHELEQKIEKGATSNENIKSRALLNLMDKYPNIENKELQKIKSPVLIMGSDADLIKLEHLVAIYQNIPKAQLFIMPGATHEMPVYEHALFNQIASRFLTNPFKKAPLQGNN